MKKIAEKVAIVAQISIALIFAITTLLYMFNVIPENVAFSNNGVLGVLIWVLAIIFLVLSGFIVYVNFSEKETLRQILLHCDSESATHANSKVIRNIVRSCAKKVEGIRVKKVQLRLDEKNGLVVTLKVNVATHNVSESIDILRCLVADAFKNTLGLTFNSINFVIRKLKSRYRPDVDKAEKLAKTLTQQRELSADIYEQPFTDNCEECAKADEDAESNAEKEDVEAVKEIREQLHDNGQSSNNEQNEPED